jgi:two-component system alkaline phosphatase synthesis response regulator PhoP
LRILLVEDDPLNIELFDATLEVDGHAVTVERDGVAGEERALRDPFDLILLDIQLPRRTGLEVCRNLRSAGVRTPIVALSASVLRDEIARTIEAGFTEFLAKPISPEALRVAVRAHSPERRPA